MFKHRPSGVYFLDLPGDTETPFEQLIDEAVLQPEKAYDISFLTAFKKANPELMHDVILHDYVVEDALWVSEIFQTSVLSSYANDEDCDFLAVAENGKLKRLRIKAGRRELRQLGEDEARAIITEIAAVKILPDEDDDGVFEYEDFEALQSEDEPLRLLPYHRYFEGELSRQAIFKTLSSEPGNYIPNLMFRNIHIEFQEVFGHEAPDFFDPQSQDFELVSSFSPDPNPAGNILRFIAGVLVLPFALTGALVLKLFGNKRSGQGLKVIIGGLVLALIAFSYFLGPEGPPETDGFEAQCLSQGGEAKSEKSCEIDGQNFTKMDLPGETGDLTKLGVTVSADKAPCKTNPGQCLLIDEAVFEGTIKAFSHKPGVKSLVIIERRQLCHPFRDADCSIETAYAYEAVRQIDL